MRRVTIHTPALLSAWRYPAYRLLWAAQLCVNSARWMDTLVVAWVILDLTDSPFLVGVAGAFRTAGMIAGPFCGVIADRFNRRRTMIVAQVGWAACALTMMTLFFLGQLQVWYIIVYVFITGISFAFNFSTAFAVAADIAEGQQTSNAITLLIITNTFASGMGPWLGGSLLDRIHAGGAFALTSTLLLLALAFLLFMRIATPQKQTTVELVWSSLVAGFRYVATHRALLSLILIAVVINLFMGSIKPIVIPVLGRDVMGVSASALGLAMGAIGMGGILGGLTLATMDPATNKWRLLTAAVVFWSATCFLLSAITEFAVSLPVFIMVGTAEAFTFALIQVLLVKESSVEMRGRVLGIRAFAISPLLVGSLLTGATTDFWGAPATLIIAPLAFLASSIPIIVWASRSRRAS